MFSTRWRKVVRELWTNRTRSALVVVSIAVGIFAVGTVQHLRTVILREMQAAYATTNAAQVNLFTNGVNDAMLDAIRRMPEVADAQGRSSLLVKVQTGVDEWTNLALTAIDDFADIRIDRVQQVYQVDGHPDVGAERTAWPQENEVILERSAFDSATALPAGLRVGDPLVLRTGDDKIRKVTVSGVLYNPNGFPSTFTGTASGYVTYDTFVRLGGSRHYAQITLRVNGSAAEQLDETYLTGIADKVQDKLEKSGYVVQRSQVPEPGKLPLQDIFDALALLLTPLGVLALGMSGFLVINTISALMAQQVRQIGIMKAIGAQRYQVVWLYLGAVLVYSLAALVVAVPLTVVIAGAIAHFLGGFINIDFPRWALPFNVLLIQLGVGLLIPLLAALWPIFRGTAVSVREAISDYGTGTRGANEGWLTRLLNSIRGIPRPLQLSLRNTFRRKARLTLTLITLMLGGMIFMTVGSVRASLDGLIETGLDYYQFDIQLQLARPYRTFKIQQIVDGMPDIALMEGWGIAQAARVRADGSKSNPLTITALAADSAMVKPTLSRGRWLRLDDDNGIVISQNVAAAEPDIQLGDTIVLEINDKQTPWVVVGVAQVLGGPPDQIPAYVNYPYFARVTNDVGRATSIQLKLDSASKLTQDEAAALVNERLEDAGYDVSSVFTIATLRRFTGAFFDIIVYLLLAMGILIAAVGALGLAGTMSTNVLERTREIGVMRAIGASDSSVQKIVIVEGLVIGGISWLLGALLAFPIGALLASTVGLVLFQEALPYTFSANGVVTWFGIVLVLAVVASFLPARGASRLTVREVLAYQ